MKTIANEIYYIYNQGNNKETIFYTDEDFIKFLSLFRKYVSPHCKVLAYCLMPNHFHFLIYATEDAATIKRIGNIDSSVLSNAFRLLQSSYAQYINKKYNRSGSLFRQKAKAKSTAEADLHYDFVAFQYIHQNPFKSGLVSKMEDWPYSSFCDYAGYRNGTLCDKILAQQRIGFSKDDFVKESYNLIDERLVEKIFEKRSAP